MLLTKEVEIKIRPQTLKHYESLGYKIPMKRATNNTYAKYKKEFVYDFNKPIIVKVEDLLPQSNVKVDVLCDYCREETFSIVYSRYNDEARCVAKHACKNCWQKKQEEVTTIKYGVPYVLELESVQRKCKETLQKNYDVSIPLQSKKIKEKQVQTVHNTYGVENISQLKEVKEQKARTTFEHFGVDVPSRSEEIKRKMSETCERRYGYSNPAKSPQVREKISETLYTNSSQRTSKQQLYIFNLYKLTNSTAQLNFPIVYYNGDICFPEEKIVVEYDGGFHDGQVKMGKLTQKEFDQKELTRDKVIKSEGYKIVRIKSDTDYLPQDVVLFQMLNEAKYYFATTNHTWATYDIDKSMLYNAIHKQGIPYNFGSLRKIS